MLKALWKTVQLGARSPVSIYVSMSMLAQLVPMACGILVLQWVPPRDMGIWFALQVAESYSLWIRLGVLNAMNREYPFLMGQGKTAEAIRHVQTTASYIRGCASIMFAGFVGAGFFLFHRGPDWRWAATAYAMYSAATMWRNLLEATFRGGQEFARLAKLQMITIGLNIVSLPMVYYGGFQGYCGRAATLGVIITGLYHAARPVRSRLSFDRKIFTKLMLDGMPLFASNYLTSLAAQFPRVLLLYAGGTALLGVYTPISAILSTGALLPGAILVYLAPRQHYRFGQNKDPKAIREAAWRQAISISLALLPVGLIASLILPHQVERWLPRYAACVPAIKWAAIAIALSPLSIATSVFVTVKAWGPQIVYVVLGLALAGIFPWVLLRWHNLDPMVAVTLGTLLAQVAQVVCAWICIRWAARVSMVKDAVCA